MNKSPEAFRTISEVAEALDVPAHVLRFWETRFSQVKPVKRGGGRRYYRPDDVRLLRGIRGLLYEDGMTIKGVQKILREQGVRHVIQLGTVDEAEEAAPAPAPKAAQRNAGSRPAAAQAKASAPAPGPAEGGPNAVAPGTAAAAGDLLAPLAAEAEAAAATDGAEAASATDASEAPAGVEAAGGGDGDAGGAVRPIDREALRALVAELEALRARMIEPPTPG